jgi:hypothetical protein
MKPVRCARQHDATLRTFYVKLPVGDNELSDDGLAQFARQIFKLRELSIVRVDPSLPFNEHALIPTTPYTPIVYYQKSLYQVPPMLGQRRNAHYVRWSHLFPDSTSIEDLAMLRDKCANVYLFEASTIGAMLIRQALAYDTRVLYGEMYTRTACKLYRARCVDKQIRQADNIGYYQIKPEFVGQKEKQATFMLIFMHASIRADLTSAQCATILQEWVYSLCVQSEHALYAQEFAQRSRENIEHYLFMLSPKINVERSVDVILSAAAVAIESTEIKAVFDTVQ